MLTSKVMWFKRYETVNFFSKMMQLESGVEKVLSWIDSESEEMAALVLKWASINTGQDNLEGLKTLSDDLKIAFSRLHPETTLLLPHHCLRFSKRPFAPIRILFAGHFDTVFSKAHPFQKVSSIEKNLLQGPGVVDMKGGLVILLKALEAFEKSPYCEGLGWEILLNSDEEIGSPFSTPFLESCAQVCDAAILFEPCLPDGALVCARKSSSTYSIASKGQSAHAGRDFIKGKNAILPLSQWLIEMHDASKKEGIIFNIGFIHGGESVNVVPSSAEAKVNMRAHTTSQVQEFEQKMFKSADEIGLQLTRLYYRPPKPLTSEVKNMLDELDACGKALGLELTWRESGGVCDGNTLAAFGLPTVDTLGARGDFIHTDQECLDLLSLPERAKLTALFLIKASTNQTSLKRKRAS